MDEFTWRRHIVGEEHGRPPRRELRGILAFKGHWKRRRRKR